MVSLFELIDEFYEIEPQQKLMLQALILKGPRARKSFKCWLTKVDFEAMDVFNLGLVPALLRKFGDMLGDSQHLARMQGIQRYYLFRNSLIFAEGRRVVARLISEGIDVLLFKGIAVSLKYHRNHSIRPMGDIDALVHPEDVCRAEEILLQSGFSYLYPERDKGTDSHSHDYVNSRYCGFDLHWYALLESLHPGIDDGLWQRAEFFDWDGLVVKLMSPEDLILTSTVNGVRDIEPLRPQWIYDLACIVETEPALLWQTVWAETKARGLREKVLDAFKLVHGISRESVPEEYSNVILSNDPEFCRELLSSTISEGRTYHLNCAANDEITAILAIGDDKSPIVNRDVIGSTSSPGYIRYFLSEEGAINRLFLQWRHLPRIAELFKVSDPAMLESLIASCPKTEVVYLDVSPGLLTTKPRLTLPAYSARLTIIGGNKKLILNPGEVAEIEIEVENDSPHCWHVCAGSKALFGVSYHLLAEDGTLETWDWPRTFLTKEWSGYVAFIEPSQIFSCKLAIHAPREPGRYIAQLDLVQEYVTWFSQRGNEFPKIDLEVKRYELLDSNYVSASGILHETIGCETVIINTYSGVYYSVEGYAAVIWNAIADGYSANSVIAAFASAGIYDPAQRIVQTFISQLVTEQLITPVRGDEVVSRGEFHVEKLSEVQDPVLAKHADPRELTLTHPARQVSLSAGWPHRNDTAAE